MADRARLAQPWLAKARRDLAAAVRLMAGEPPYADSAVYHCQQAAEKALKGFLAAYDRPPRRVHDLILLLDECVAIDPSFDPLAEAAALLTPYATAFRYPGDPTEPDASEALEAIAAARQIISLVEARLPHAPTR